MTTTQARAVSARSVGDRLFWPFAAMIVLLSAVLRLVNLDRRPGWDWDESVYATVGRNVMESGLIQTKTEYLASPEAYLYHPPFHFLLEGAWFNLFGAGVTQARYLAVASSLVMVLLLMVFLRRIIGNWGSLIGGFLVTVDAWMIFSERVSWIENAQMPLGVLGLMIYWYGYDKWKTSGFVLSGVVLGLVTAYKHIGVIFLGAVLIHWLIVRKQPGRHMKMLLSAGAVIVAYLGIMTLVFGEVFWRQSLHQFLRSTGEQESRGALNKIGDFVNPLFAQYKIFAVTLVLVGIAMWLFGVRIVQMIKQRSIAPIKEHSLLFAWAAAATLFFIALQLRFPHYFMLILLPLLVYLAAEVRMVLAKSRQATGHRRDRSLAARRLVLVALLVITGSNGIAFYYRFVAPQNDNALVATRDWMAVNVPWAAKVITEESVGTTIVQPYCKMWRGADCNGATYIATYTSHTQQLPKDERLRQLIDSGTQVYQTTGFKETITVYRLSKSVG